MTNKKNKVKKNKKISAIVKKSKLSKKKVNKKITKKNKVIKDFKYFANRYGIEKDFAGEIYSKKFRKNQFLINYEVDVNINPTEEYKLYYAFERLTKIIALDIKKTFLIRIGVMIQNNNDTKFISSVLSPPSLLFNRIEEILNKIPISINKYELTDGYLITKIFVKTYNHV